MHHLKKNILELINLLLRTKKWVKKSSEGYDWETNFKYKKWMEK